MSLQVFDKGIFLKQYRNSIIKEIFRKSIHICSALIPILLDKFYLPVIISLLVILIIYCLSEFFRFRGIEFPVIAKVTAAAARKRDENKFVLGPVTLVIGILLAALLWKPEFYRIGIFALAFGDGSASLAGKLLGRLHIPFTKGKTAAGSLTCFFAVFISSFIVCKNSFASIIIALSAMIIEIFPITDFDNIIIPVAAGGISQFLLTL